jgi:Ca2+-binding EF-hand superfamily protein
VIDSNRIVDVNKVKKESEVKMEMFLKSSNLGETIQKHIHTEEIKARFNALYNDNTGWTTIKGSKKYNIVGQSKKYEVFFSGCFRG